MKHLLDEKSRKKIEELKNPNVLRIIEQYAELCNPRKIIVITDSKEDKEFVRRKAIELNEEKPLSMQGTTFHFEGLNDQGRDTANTKILVEQGQKLSRYINAIDRDEGLKEIHGIMKGSMKGTDMLVLFFCLGPIDSKFSLPALQITNSYYVGHSEDILYRPGYEYFKKLKDKESFFHFVHSTGELENNVSKDFEKKRMYNDLKGGCVLSVNTQYGGNSMGLKKLALRLAINKSSKEDWLCEHMFISGVKALKKNRTTYFTGAFPSMCGKTSTAMIPGNTLVGDDIAYIIPGEDGYAYAANVEQGIFGIIQDVNAKDDPLIYEALTTPREIIFSNVLIADGKPYWTGMGREMPEKGINWTGEWFKGKQDSKGAVIPGSQKNARFTIRIRELKNADKNCDSIEGVKVRGFIYGGRDSNTSVPVLQTFSWAHGVYLGAALESETTAAVIGGNEGALKHDPMANMDFLVIPLGLYIKKHLKFGEDVAEAPLIFTTNYFLKDENGSFFSEKVDKKIWLLWMEGRVHNEFEALETPIGFIPKYDDLKKLFKQVFSKEFTQESYVKMFSIRIPQLLKRIDRIEAIFKDEEEVPEMFYTQLKEERQRLLEAKEQFGEEIISPFEFE